MNIQTINPILLDFPEIIESERLIIRAPLWGDGEALNAAVRESMDELRQWMPWAQAVPTVEQSEIGIRQSRLQFLERTDMRLLLLHKETNEIVGSSGLHRMDWQVRKFEIGYWVRTSFEKQGYVTEAVEAITNFAIQQLHANRIEIRCDSRNTRSANVAKRLGFTLEGILRNDMFAVDGSLRHTMVFSMVRDVDF